jgi:phosphoserine phosphatase RsbU/P
MSQEIEQTSKDPVATAANLQPEVRQSILNKRLDRLHHDLSSVHETSRLLTGPMDLQQVLEIVVKTVAEAIGAEAAGLRLLDENTGELVLKATYGLSEEYKTKGPVTAGESILNKRALSGEPIIVENMLTDSHFKKYHDEIQKEGLVSNLSIGLLYKNKGIGIMRLYNKRPRLYSEADVSLAQTIASQSAAAIVNARLYAEALEGERMLRQIRLAGDVQRHLIPARPPAVPGLDIAGMYVPCYDVGGDFYDFLPLPDGRLLLSIGDIMGKGVPASLAMASLRSGLRAYAEQFQDVNELVQRVNIMFCHDVVFGEFATIFCASYDPSHRTLTYCNGGHEPAILLQDQKTVSLSEGGTVLGIDKKTVYQTHTIELHTNDMLILYTDGLADAVNFRRESFGRQRIIEAARNSREMPAEQAAKNILWLMRKYTGLTKRFDDMALVVVKITDQGNR